MDASAFARTATVPDPDPVAVLATDFGLTALLCQWLSLPTRYGMRRYDPKPWSATLLNAATAAHHRGVPTAVCPAAEAASDRWLPGRRTLVTYWPAPSGVTALTGRLLDVLPRGALWLGLGPLARDDAVAWTARTAEAGIRYVHSPYLESPEEMPMPGSRPLARIYSTKPAADRALHNLVAALTAYTTWAGPLPGVAPTLSGGPQ